MGDGEIRVNGSKGCWEGGVGGGRGSQREIRETDMFPTCDGSSVCRSSLDTDLEKKEKS